MEQVSLFNDHRLVEAIVKDFPVEGEENYDLQLASQVVVSAWLNPRTMTKR